CYVGWVPGGMIEITAMDPLLGPVFYRLDSRKNGHQPHIVRSDDCLSCHSGSRTGGVPGMLVRSVHSDADGFPIFSAGTFQTDHRSPLHERWGGWYVTGENAGRRHLGNLIFKAEKNGKALVATDNGAALADLKEIIDSDAYLTPRSDIVALMVLEHQVLAHNEITKAHFNTRKWIHYQRSMARHFGEPEEHLSDSTRKLIDRQASDLLRVLFFIDETPLEDWGVEGHESFQRVFLSRAKTSASGRSLRDFQLLSRLFKHRFSYMIHSKAFEALPTTFKTIFYEKMWQVLNGKGPEETYGHLKASTSRRIIEILREHQADLPACWKP
ncbi:MAG: hypothetical protein AAF514_05985, partial [Verrucomicrobiota bacterium]